MINNILLLLWGSLFGYIIATVQIAKVLVRKGYRRLDEIPDNNQSKTNALSSGTSIVLGSWHDLQYDLGWSAYLSAGPDKII